MAAYAALVSLMHIIEQIKHHPRPPVSLDNRQAESLSEKVTFLQDFLEGYSHFGNNEADSLQSRIADTAYAAEDIIESHVVDQILAQSTSTTHGENISSVDFYQSLQKVIEDMDFIKKEVMEIQEKTGIQDQLHRNPMPAAGSLKSSSTEKNSMVGFRDFRKELVDKLTGHQTTRQIIPIIGMGGIGKTTLARNVYEDLCIVQHFDCLAWATISQEYSVREILLEVLLCLKHQGGTESLSKKSEEKLGEILHKSLWGRRYLIIMDDMWSIEAWDKIKFFFPDNNNGSRIIITTRLSNMVLHLNGDNGLEMNFLDEVESWNLLRKSIFGKEGCPLALEKVGKKIAKSCKGLPLSIVVVGGLLAKSKQTSEYWEYIAENLNSIVNLEDNEHCLKILQASYTQLPVHLKPCFLYMGVFPEDHKIRVSRLIKLWVAEGFLKPICGKDLEEVAEDCLKDLVTRNLILVHKWGSNGKIKFCNIHDLLRDLCLREAEKDKFLCVTRQRSIGIPQGINTQRRIAIHQSTSKEEHLPLVLHALQSASLARSLICDFRGVLPSLSFRLLRVLRAVDKQFYTKKSLKKYKYFLEAIFQLVNSRYLAIRAHWNEDSTFPSSVYLLWNLQTLVVQGTWNNTIAPSEIWQMPQLRHVEFDRLYLPDPPVEWGDDFVLENLQTLLRIGDFYFGEEVIKRIPNVKKLQIFYDEFEEGSGSLYCLNNLPRLHKLESLCCFFSDEEMKPSQSDLLQNLNFPHSLKKLTLKGSHLQWEDMTTKIGSLPLLEVLKLRAYSFLGPEWETFEGQFCSLKFLAIYGCGNLERWKTDSTHFPRLEKLVLRRLDKLEEIPSSVGDIPTLQLIELYSCSKSAVLSAKKILEEQKELGNTDLEVQILYPQEQKSSTCNIL